MKKLLFLAAVLFTAAAPAAHGASFFFDPKEASREPSRITLYFDSASSSINALEGTLTFDPAKIEVISVDDGGTAVSAWLESPKLEEGSIRFAGIIAGGLVSRDIPVLNLTVRMKEDIALFSMIGEGAYINDGSGTALSLQKSFLEIREGSGQAPLEDRIPPESFTPEISRDPAIFDNKYFISWSTTDKESGIERYEVLEAPVFGYSGLGSWKTAVSPYLLQNQGRRGSIYVRAVDRAGNFRIVEVPPQSKSNTQYLYIILFIVLICLMVGWRRKKRRT